MMALAAVVVAAAVLMVWIQGARVQRDTAMMVRGAVGSAQPAIEWSVLDRRIEDGEALTRIRVQERRADGERGPALEGLLSGEQMFIELDRIAWTESGEAALEIPVFSRILGLDGAGSSTGPQGVDLLDPEVPIPFYFAARGERARGMEKSEQRFWRALFEGEPGHALTTSRPVPLILGQQWEAVYRSDGEIELNLLRSTEDRYRYEPDRVHSTSSGLGVRVLRYDRQPEREGRIDPERVFHEVGLQLSNTSEADLRVDTTRFKLVDAVGNSYRAAGGGSANIPAAGVMNFTLLFPLPVGVRSPVFTIPGETELRAGTPAPLAIPLGHEPDFLGDVESLGAVLASVQRVDTLVADGQFRLEVNLQMLNTSWEPLELDSDDFELHDLETGSDRHVVASEVAPLRLPGWEPQAVVVSFDVGPELTRRDMRLVASYGRRARRASASFVLLDPEVEGRIDGATYLRQLAGVRHFQRYGALMERARGGLFRRLLGNPAAREAEAAAHLASARRLFPESEVIPAE